jgi:hypothetical protein
MMTQAAIAKLRTTKKLIGNKSYSFPGVPAFKSSEKKSEATPVLALD